MKYILLSICMYQMSYCCGNLEEFLSKLEMKPYFKEASIGVYVTDAQGKVILNCCGEKSLIPNSILKLFTTAAALKELGEDFRFHTQLLSTGSILDHELRGDLVIMGDGDPTLGREHYKELFKGWALALKEAGVQSISGSIIGDASCFEQALSPASWSWEDVGNYYGAGACGLNFHENFYRLFFKLGKNIGAVAQIEKTEPKMDYLNMINEVLSGPKGSGDRASIFGGEFSTTHYVRGTVPLDHPVFEIKGSIPDPARCCAEELRELLEGEGIVVKGKALSSFNKKSYVHAHVFSHHYSPLLSDVIFDANRHSINLYCESLLKKMGAHQKGQGTHVAGLEVIKHYLKGLNLSMEGCRILDGSGLSSKNLITAKAMVEFLSKISKEPYFPSLIRSLPSTSEEIGHLKKMFSSPALKGKIRAKTGFSSQGESAAGFLTTHRGEQLRFCIIANHFLGSSAALRKEMTDLFELLLVY